MMPARCRPEPILVHTAKGEDRAALIINNE